jgi:hypothetical protein
LGCEKCGLVFLLRCIAFYHKEGASHQRLQSPISFSTRSVA